MKKIEGFYKNGARAIVNAQNYLKNKEYMKAKEFYMLAEQNLVEAISIAGDINNADIVGELQDLLWFVSIELDELEEEVSIY